MRRRLATLLAVLLVGASTTAAASSPHMTAYWDVVLTYCTGTDTHHPEDTRRSGIETYGRANVWQTRKRIGIVTLYDPNANIMAQDYNPGRCRRP